MPLPPTKTLPDGYRDAWRLSLRDRAVLVRVNVWGTVLAIASLVGFGALALVLRQGELGAGGSAEIGLIDIVVGIVLLVAITAVVVTLHEAVHGVVLWRVTGERPRFGYRGLYAYTAAPDWYLPRRPYVLIAVAPIPVLSLLGVVLLAVAPLSWIPGVLLALVTNAAGAVGDLLIVRRVLASSPDGLANDRGDDVTFFEPLG